MSNASRTMLLNIDTLKWDSILMKFFGISAGVLPDVGSNSEIYGYISEGPLSGLPFSGYWDDKHCRSTMFITRTGDSLTGLCV